MMCKLFLPFGAWRLEVAAVFVPGNICLFVQEHVQLARPEQQREDPLSKVQVEVVIVQAQVHCGPRSLPCKELPHNILFNLRCYFKGFFVVIIIVVIVIQ